MSALRPLFVKYRTQSGTPYVYDSLTGEIVRIDDTLYQLVDDYGVLSDAEIALKHSNIRKQALDQAISDLRSMELQGMLCRRPAPTKATVPQMVAFRGQEWAPIDLIKTHCRTLILEVTQQCNLRCKYCCYGSYYPDRRSHSSTRMTWEIAHKALDEFFEKLLNPSGVGFYGGEPLLELDLIKRVIQVVEERGRSIGKELHLTMTTNGTLLDDDAIHFLVEHNVNVTISLDGPRESHDRYRVFRDSSGRRRGSFDCVMKNIRRFIELYPDYGRRGINMVLSFPIALEEMNRLLRGILPYFPFSRADFAQCSPEHASWYRNHPFHVGCGMVPCGSDSRCSASAMGAKDDNGVVFADTDRGTPEFLTWSEANRSEYTAMIDSYSDCIKNKGLGVAQRDFPLASVLAAQGLLFIHLRPIRKHSACIPVLPCLPGYIRVLCSSLGEYFPCERMQAGGICTLGDVWKGFDPEASIRSVRLFKTMVDCANCTALGICSLCIARINRVDEEWDGLGMQAACRGVRDFLHESLKRYSEILEANPTAFEGLMDVDRLSEIQALFLIDVSLLQTGSDFGLASEQLSEDKMLW